MSRYTSEIKKKKKNAPLPIIPHPLLSAHAVMLPFSMPPTPMHILPIIILPGSACQQPQNSFTSRVGQKCYLPGKGLPQGEESLQQNFIQPVPSTPPVNLQPSLAPSILQPNSLGGPQQMQATHKNFIEMPLLQLTGVYSQLARTVEEGKRNLNTTGNIGGERDI